MNVFSRLLFGGAAAALLSCKEGTTVPAVPQSLAFGAEVAALIADDSLVAGATLTMSDGSAGSPNAISYSSSNTSVATVGNRGLIRAIAAGVATITARAGSLQDDLAVTVTWAPITGLAFPVEQAAILLDDTLATRVVVTNSRNRPALNASVAYVSSNPLVASIDATGRVRALLIGRTTITATEGSLSDELEVTVVPHFTDIAVGGTHSCGITGMRQLYCWGDDINGELGAGTSAPICNPQSVTRCSPVPIAVAGGDRFVSMTLGDFHTCALTAAGVAYCWGDNDTGALGLGTLQDKATTPSPVVGGHTFIALGAGRAHTCGITTEGDTYCWGWDHWGQLGAGSAGTDRCDFFFANSPCSRAPVKVVGDRRFLQVTASGRASCGRTAANTIFCWGLEVGGTENTNCQFGQISTCTRTPLLQVSGSTFAIFGMGDLVRCGQKLDATIQCWGADYNNFGNGSAFPTYSGTPVVAAGGNTYQYGGVIFGRLHVCGMNAGVVECWGNGGLGQPGGTVGTNRNKPGPVFANGITFSKIVSGPVSDLSCGIATTGRAYCWGNGALGQLGNNAFASSAVAVLVKLVR